MPGLTGTGTGTDDATDDGVPRAPSLVVGVGAGRGVSGGEVLGLIGRVLDGAGLSLCCVTELATAEAKAGEPGLLAAADRLRLPLRAYTADVLAAVEVPNPSDVPRAAVGTPSVAEAAALAAAGEGGLLIVPKAKSAPPNGSPARATAAVARRGRAGNPAAADGVSGSRGPARAAAAPTSSSRTGSSPDAADESGAPRATVPVRDSQHSKENP
ncbi:Cobalamin synthesis G C-terminus [Streptomyces sp. WMMB 322]|nr:Cobalamin synthesis G C-terminus [Streptomyces sp. WMMB 322]